MIIQFRVQVIDTTDGADISFNFLSKFEMDKFINLIDTADNYHIKYNKSKLFKSSINKIEWLDIND